MKKIALLIAAVAVMAAAQAQVVVGLQGGYYQNKTDYNYVGDYQHNSNWLAGAQVGYMITQKLYVGVVGQFNSFTNDKMLERNIIPYEGMAPNPTVENYRLYSTQMGWSVSPTVKYEICRYGNMHFNLQLQGTYGKMGYTKTIESFNKPWINNNEYEERDAVYDSIGTANLIVSLRPTLVYEFSTHLSAELSLDFLSIGYARQTTTNDALTNADGDNLQRTVSTLYAGLNTLNETFHWENPLLRLGFNYTF